MNFDNILFHCSSLGYIMTDPKEKSNKQLYDEALEKLEIQNSKYEKYEKELEAIKNKVTKTYERKEQTFINCGARIYDLEEEIKRLRAIKDIVPLSDTCKRHLMILFVEQRYGRTYDIKSKYLEKGIMLEEKALDEYSLALNEYYVKNKIRKANGYVTGEIDFPATETSLRVLINDAKVSWDIFTFWNSIAKGLEPMYYWQAQGYMWLWGMDECNIIKVLLDTPDKLIENEKKNLLRDFVGTTEQYEAACIELEYKMRYPDIPMNERIMEFNVKRNQSDIDRIPERILECRDFLNTINNNVGFYYEMARES